MLGDQRGLLGLVLLGHFLGVAAGGLRVPEFLVLDREEFGAEAFHLLLGGRADVGRGHDRAEPARGRDRLQPRNTHAHDEHARRRHGAGRRHHHRERAAELGRGVDHGAVAREVRLAREHVHHLRAGDARHQLHREADDAGLRHGGERGLVAVRVHDRHHERAGLVGRDLRIGRAAHLEHHVGILDGIGRAAGDRRAHGLVVRIEHAGLHPRAALHDHVDAKRLHLLHGVGRGGDARLGRVDLGGNGDFHGSLLASETAQTRK